MSNIIYLIIDHVSNFFKRLKEIWEILDINQSFKDIAYFFYKIIFKDSFEYIKVIVKTYVYYNEDINNKYIIFEKLKSCMEQDLIIEILRFIIIGYIVTKVHTFITTKISSFIMKIIIKKFPWLSEKRVTDLIYIFVTIVTTISLYIFYIFKLR